MKFLVDAQLPRRMAAWLTSRGHDAMHTLDLPRRNLSSDADVCAIADSENRVVVTKVTISYAASCFMTARSACCSSPPATSPTTI